MLNLHHTAALGYPHQSCHDNVICLVLVTGEAGSSANVPLVCLCGTTQALHHMLPRQECHGCLNCRVFRLCFPSELQAGSYLRASFLLFWLSMLGALRSN